jgi:BlaI family penicillinase repressor
MSQHLRDGTSESLGVISNRRETNVRVLSLTYDLIRCIVLHMPKIRPNPKLEALPLPTAAEVDILAVLWRLGPATVREVHDQLGKDCGYTTTLKQMQLMTEKGLLIRSERFRSHVYESAVPREQTQKQIAGDLLKRVFDGSARSLVLGALSAQPATGKELSDIRKMLEVFAKEKGRCQ